MAKRVLRADLIKYLKSPEGQRALAKSARVFELMEEESRRAREETRTYLRSIKDLPMDAPLRVRGK